ncbi:YggS family pyridoxal phosphate-dependent enzyme [Microbacterium sediminis]|uniref:Pyridoxal phosphate homeostasis protein n=1 Tax=Microbacterium sediminis TaxID=904291 RepID=A0A1B9N9D0_9MICO|nr:YggS family pyridoxal phosphate-dependent enzyme [Microbacterium sediminis]OCG73154.1 YggS family pyridoxal phosphate enzyme [Microbacterium sediminis]
MTDLAARLADVDARLAAAAREAGRDPADITRIVVTKFHPASLVRELHGLGVRDVGENRQQELTAKADDCADLDGVRWHFIGQLQSKKAAAVRRAATVVHSVDRPKVADALHAAGEELPVLDVLMQVNLTDDPGRGGVAPEGIESLAEHILGLDSLRLRGVMAVAPLGEPPAEAFERLAGYADRVYRMSPQATWLSAGMTGDFAEAIAVGATHLRIGTAITGARPDRA